jgi:serine/threonine-protein kinase HipA
MTDALQVWTDNTLMAVIVHEGRDDLWHLRYAPLWLANHQAFPLSPALSLGRAPDEHASATIKRFIEHLLPEGRALEVAVAYKGLTKSKKVMKLDTGFPGKPTKWAAPFAGSRRTCP